MAAFRRLQHRTETLWDQGSHADNNRHRDDSPLDDDVACRMPSYHLLIAGIVAIHSS
jgi:hypothetical protein